MKSACEERNLVRPDYSSPWSGALVYRLTRKELFANVTPRGSLNESFACSAIDLQTDLEVRGLQPFLPEGGCRDTDDRRLPMGRIDGSTHVLAAQGVLRALSNGSNCAVLRLERVKADAEVWAPDRHIGGCWLDWLLLLPLLLALSRCPTLGLSASYVGKVM